MASGKPFHFMKKTKTTTGTKVPFFPASEEFRAIKAEMFDALELVGTSGQLILGPNVTEFEQRLATLTENKFCVSCANGTDALTLALKSLSLSGTDEVIVPANSYPTIFGVALSGVKPVLCDVNLDTGNIDPESFLKSITPKTKAVVVVHLYGQPVDISQITRICKARSLHLVEDCAQAFGATYQSKPVGSFGTVATFSFYPTKNLGAYGDGGAIVTSNNDIADRLRRLRTYGEASRYQSEELGHNSRLDELQAAFLLKKLQYIGQWIEMRNQLATIYLDMLKDISEISLPIPAHDRLHTYHLFPIKTRQRMDLKTWLTRHGIESGIHYPYPIHFVQTFKHLGDKGDFPNAEQWSQEELSLPIHPYLSEEQIIFVANSIKKFFTKNKER